MKDLSQIIRSARVSQGLSQKKLGELLGVSDRAVSKWEKGLSRPSVENFVSLANILGISTDKFFKKEIAFESELSSGSEKGMNSVREIYKIGRGPSSSHTIGPEQACLYFKNKFPGADSFRAILYGSLAKTGKGHGTDSVIKKTFLPFNCEILWNTSEKNIPHPNTLDLIAYKNREEIGKDRVFSVGGGSILIEGCPSSKPEIVYPHSSFSEISEYCKKRSMSLWEYVFEHEIGIEEHLKTVWSVMKESIYRGIEDEGVLPGGLDILKKAKMLYNDQHIDESRETAENRLVCAYAFAVGEQNAAGEKIVTAPTCGAAGVLPSVLFYYKNKKGLEETDVIHALATAGLIGNLIKTNASISGAECGCQAEIGSACAMAAAALAELHGLSIDKIEYAAEIAIEHHLGLTCDPICGLVQIPCIERNAVAAMRAINAVNLASFLWNTRKISFDKVVLAMKETGRDMHTSYKETAEAGLAKISIGSETK